MALSDAKELLENYWNRDTVQTNDGYATDVQADALARQAELQTIIVYVLIEIAETLASIRENERWVK